MQPVPAKILTPHNITIFLLNAICRSLTEAGQEGGSNPSQLQALLASLATGLKISCMRLA
jgi:hypothetical protein